MAHEQTKKAVPGIPLAALDAIADRNTRDVLRALVDGHHVRNGNSGSGDERFITAREAGLVKGRTGFGVGGMGGSNGGNGGNGNNGGGGRPLDVAGLISDLEASIIESPLFKKLGERVDLIDTPNGVIAGLSNEHFTRISSDNSIAQNVNTIWATLGGNAALVQDGQMTAVNNVGAVALAWQQTQASVKDADGNYVYSAAIKAQSQATADKMGNAEARYTVQLNVNGVAGGFGLIGTSDLNNPPKFAFGVRADTFWIAGTAALDVDTSKAPIPVASIPFIVSTDPNAKTSNGKPIIPGVYMKSAFITELTADQINTKGLSIKDADGKVLFESGTSLANQTGSNPNLVEALDAWNLVGATRNAVGTLGVQGASIMVRGGNYATSRNLSADVGGGTFTLSFRAKGITGQVIRVRPARTGWEGPEVFDFTITSANNNKDTSYAVTFSIASLAGCRLQVQQMSGTAQWIEIADIKLERGAKQTAWSDSVITAKNVSTFIADLAVNTLQIAGNAVSATDFATSNSPTVSLTFTTADTYDIFVLASMVQSYYSEITLYRNGIPLWGEHPADGTLATRGYSDKKLPAGTHTYTLASNHSGNINGASIYISILKR